MKLGLDLHKTITYNPKYFVTYAWWVKHRLGGEVHIITGSRDGDDITEELLGYADGIKWWDKLFSITDHLLSLKTVHVTEIKDGKTHYSFPSQFWNPVKAEYCRKHLIDLHIDDCEEYLKYFTTPYMLYKGRPVEEGLDHYKQSRLAGSEPKQLKTWSDYEI